jgi:hypothetical protein
VSLIERKTRERAESAGEKDKKKVEELPLIKSGEALKKQLTALEKRLWQAPEAKGILSETDVLTQIAIASGYVTSSWDPPSPTHLAHLARAEALLQGILAETNRMLEGDVASYRQQAAAAGIGLLPVQEPLRLGTPGN